MVDVNFVKKGNGKICFCFHRVRTLEIKKKSNSQRAYNLIMSHYVLKFSAFITDEDVMF